MSSPHQSRFKMHPALTTAFALFAFALLLALPARSGAQGQGAADIQLAADQTLSTTTTVEAQGGQTVVIELFGTGFTDAIALQTTIEVDDATAISGTPTVDGNPTYFPPSPFASVTQQGNAFTANLSTQFLPTGPTRVSSSETTPQYLELGYDAVNGYRVAVYLCVGQSIHTVSPTDAVDIGVLPSPTLESMRAYLDASATGTAFIRLAESSHKIKRKAEQMACQSVLEGMDGERA